MFRLLLSFSMMCSLALSLQVNAVGAMEGAQGFAPGANVVQAKGTGLSQLSGVLSRSGQYFQPAQYSCRRACKRCRRHCIVDWKWDCEGYGCRRGFSQCMKLCWNDICRDC